MFYAVARGHTVGIFEEWGPACQAVTRFPGAQYKSFPTRAAAEQYLAENPPLEEPCAMLDPSRLDQLTGEQRSVLDFMLRGDNVFLTGGGGVGKSYLLSVIYTEYPGMRRRRDGGARLPRIQMCALTGCAALLLGHKAKTIHSWAGIGLGKGTVAELHMKIKKNRKAMQKWLLTDLLIIDEISMMTAELLDKLNELGKKLRGNKRPFGGIQLLLVGDFYQLPPVNRSDEPTRFAFESEAWKEGIQTIVELTQIQRQKDEVFQKILTEARRGALTSESCATLRSREGLDWKGNKIKPTLLFPRRAEVELINETNIKALKGARHTYKARLVYDGKMPAGFIETDEGFQQALQKFDADAAYSTQLELVQDAQVMLIANVDPDAGLVNGSRGYIVGFCGASDLPMVEFVNGVRRPIGTHGWPIEEYEFCARTQIPLRLAWACTTHKAQGCSLDSALVDIGSGNFEFGQAYVALSRARSLEALYVHDFDPIAFKAHPKVKAFYHSMVRAEMEPGEQAQIRESAIVDPDAKAVIAEPSRAVQGICVTKLDAEATASASSDPTATSDSKESLDPGAALTNWLYDSVPSSWKACVSAEALTPLSALLNTKTFLPPREQIWTALEITALQDIKVVILGQDPYPTPGNAHGLAFSVLPDVRPIPASLRNIYKELASDVGCNAPAHGNLTKWAERGVLLLNTVLTVEAGAPQSHTKIGWEEVTDQLIRCIAAQTKGVVFVLWGKSAQVKKKLLAMYMQSHRVIETAHPSPLSASKGFLGSKVFSQVNQLLMEMGKEAIDWSL
jgi:ATP-dependent DNA helicase PIF1